MVEARIPSTAAVLAKLIVPNPGSLPTLGTLKTEKFAPDAVTLRAVPLPLPRMTPLEVKLEAPVPPRATSNTPDVILDV